MKKSKLFISCDEAFEICEYGAQPSKEEIKRLFPMLKN